VQANGGGKLVQLIEIKRPVSLLQHRCSNRDKRPFLEFTIACLEDIGPLATWAVVVLGADDTFDILPYPQYERSHSQTEVIPMPEPLPDKPRMPTVSTFKLSNQINLAFAQRS
jgi:hypothetical protein